MSDRIAAIRQKRWRKRQSEGQVCVRLELSQDETSILQKVGVLELHQLEDHQTIVTGIHKLIEYADLSGFNTSPDSTKR